MRLLLKEKGRLSRILPILFIASIFSVILYANTITLNTTINKCHIIYDSNSGEGSYTSTAIGHGEMDTILSLEDMKITRPNYIFTGWNTQEDGKGTSYLVGDRILLNDNVTLFAQWFSNEVPVSAVPVIPKTGDYSNTVLWIFLFIISMISILFCSLSYKK